MQGIGIRLQRLLPQQERTIVVAIDHGQTFGPMEGLTDFTAAAESLKEADGVLLAPQMVRFTGDLFYGRNSPVMIVRLNWNTVHCEPWEYEEAHIVKAFSPRAAVTVGAEAVMAGLVLKTGSEQLDAHNVQQFAQLAEEAHELGLPLIGEVFPAGRLRERPAEFHDYIVKGCRIACELGADAIKTFYTGERFAEAVDGTPIPILALGAEKMEREIQALELAYKAVCAGAAGVVFGRNVVQAADPATFLRALKEVVRGGVTPAKAAARHKLR
jgi:DhnA family fructose-bisphosphate aldolase class Ia